jgi:4-amino-4-deoxy-L-arabinose transferase-like glycosyltransferase
VTRRQRLLLAAILVLAAALRIWGLALVLPNVDGRPDEREMLVHTAAFPAGDLNPRWFVYPNLFMYLAWLWIEGGLAVRRLWIETPGYATALRDALPSVLLAGRTLSAVAGIATVALVARVAARGGDTTRGLDAAALLAVSWLHVRDSHFLKTEALLAGAVVVAIAALARWAERERTRDAVAAGVVIGLAMGIKYPAVFLLVPAWVADVTRRPGDGARRFVPSAALLGLGAAAACTFAATNPYLLLDLGRTRETASFLGLALYAGRPEAASDPGASGLGALGAWLASRAFAYHVTHSLRYGVGLLQLLVLPVAGAWACVRREPLLLLSAVFCGTLLLVAGASPVRLARYVTPLTPLVAILLADGVVALGRRTGTAGRRAAAMATLVAVLGAEPLWASIQGDRIAARTDTRVQATAWMTQAFPAAARVVVLGSVLLPLGAPQLPAGALAVPAPPIPEGYAAAGVTHVVTHDHPLLFSHVDPALMARLAPRLRLLAEFAPATREGAGGFEREDAYYLPFFDFADVVRPGPHVRIYEVIGTP